MATVRKRTLPSGATCWLAGFTDGAGQRRFRQFKTRREADQFLIGARSQVRDGSYVHDPDSVSLAVAAGQWLDHCRIRCDAGRRMEQATNCAALCGLRASEARA